MAVRMQQQDVGVTLGVYNWSTDSGPALNTLMNPYLQILSNNIMYSDNSPAQVFTADYTFTLTQSLNALDPSQIITTVISALPTSSNPLTYVLSVTLSQGGQTLTSPNFQYTFTTSPWYLAISNIFTVSSPGVIYHLTICGTLTKNLTV